METEGSDSIEKIRGNLVQDLVFSSDEKDVQGILLRNAGIGGVSARALAVQISARAKARHKLPSWFRTRGIVYPEMISVEQASSEITAAYKAAFARGIKSVADLTGGMGVDAAFFAAVCPQVTYVEKQQYLTHLARNNFPLLGRSSVRVIHTDLSEFLHEWLKHPTEMVYVDPARRSNTNRKVFRPEDCEPDMITLLPLILPHTRQVLVKFSPLLDISLLLSYWPDVVSGIHVVSVRNECRELLVLFREKPGETTLTAVNLESGQDDFVCSWQELQAAAPVTGLPEKYLYEPNASVMKAAAYDLLAARYPLRKLHLSTHLYTSSGLYAGYPGRIFEIIAFVPADRKKVAGILKDKKANISVRNFPARAEDLHKKLGLSSGGDNYLFAVSLADGRKGVLICRKAGITSTETSASGDKYPP